MKEQKMLNFLVVDDSPVAIQHITHQIQQSGHNVIGQATTAAEAVKKYKELKPDMVTMDITMPKIDGIVAVKNIISLDKDADIIMVTSHGQENLVAQALLVGAKGYILKPLSGDKLVETIGMINTNYQQTVTEEAIDSL